MVRFFEQSLQEPEARNPGIEGSFRCIDANRFSATIYCGGSAAARCTVFMGGPSFMNGIAYSATETMQSNAFNELLTIDADDQMLFLKGMGMGSSMGQQQGGKLSEEGGAAFY